MPYSWETLLEEAQKGKHVEVKDGGGIYPGKLPAMEVLELMRFKRFIRCGGHSLRLGNSNQTERKLGIMLIVADEKFQDLKGFLPALSKT